MLRSILIMLCLLMGNLVPAQTTSPTAASSPSPPLIILIGPPLSGKTAFADSIAHTYGLSIISIEDLIRDNARELDRLRAPGVSLAEMRYDPAMSRYVRKRLKAADLSRGIIFDGYPATLFQAEDLAKMSPELKLKVVALRLQVPDEAIRQRAKTSGRQSDQPQIIDQRIKDYHREMDGIAFYFPKAKIADIDGSQPEAQVWKAIQTALDEAELKSVAK